MKLKKQKEQAEEWINFILHKEEKKKCRHYKTWYTLKVKTTWNAECHYLKGGINYDFMCQSITFEWKKQETKVSSLTSQETAWWITWRRILIKDDKATQNIHYILFLKIQHTHVKTFSVKIEVKYVSIHQIAGISLVRLWQLK